MHIMNDIRDAINSYEDENINFDLNIDDIIKRFNNLRIGNHCIICDEPTESNVECLCTNYCVYPCHRNCIKKWIDVKKYDAFCIICYNQYDPIIVEAVQRLKPK